MDIMQFKIFFILICIFINETEEKEALIFDRFTRSLIQLPNDVPNDLKSGAWAIACPAETPEENDFSREYSFTENSLFVRKIYQRGDKAIDIKKNLCKDPFKVSLAYSVKSFTFQVGFEIYYDLKDERYFHINNSLDYKSPQEIASHITTLWNSAKYVAKEFYRIAKNTIGSDVGELWMNNNIRMGFVWIYLIKFRFDFSKKIVKKMDYCIGPNSRWPVFGEQCEDNGLGSELLKDVDDKIYDRAEETLTKNFKLPSDFPCKSNVKCFQRWSIVPISQFRFGTSSAPLCSHMTTIPIWNFLNLEHLLKQVDQYLYSLYRAVNEPLFIVAGTTDEIEFPKKRGFGKSTVFLDPAKKMLPVPKIIYKIVEYRIKNCKLDEKFCWFSAVITIHNDPLFKDSDRLCSKESTKDWGWNELLREPCERIYVCPRDHFITWKLFKITVRKVPSGERDLKLSEFPFSNDGETIVPRDVTGDIRNMFDKFTINGDEFNNGNAMIEMKHMSAVNPDDEDLVNGGEAVNQTENGGSENHEVPHRTDG